MTKATTKATDTDTKTKATDTETGAKRIKPVTKGGPGKPDLYDPWDLHIVGLDDEAGEEAAFFDPRIKQDIDDTFVDSIAADGIMEPVEVCSPTDPRVVFGRKRVSAARIAGQAPAEGGRGHRVLVPVIFTPAGLTQAEAESRVFTENSQRINDDALVTADKVASFLKRNGDSQDARRVLARSLGLRPSQIPELLKLRKADASVINKVKKGELGVIAALRLSKLPVVKQAEVVNKAAALATARREKEVAQIREKRAKAAEKKAGTKGKKPKADASEEVEPVQEVVKPKGKGRDITLRDVETAIAEASPSQAFVKPRTTDVREVLETLRENPFLDDGVTVESVLVWIVGDGPCPLDLTLVSSEEVA